MKTLVITVLLSLSISYPLSAQFGTEEENLVANGKFEQISAENMPEYWDISHPNYLKENETELEVLTEDDKTFYRITKRAATAPNVGSQEIQIPEGTGTLRLAMRMRGVNIARGPEAWHLPGLGITFTFPDGTSKPGNMGKWLQAPVGDSEWTDYESIVEVRDEARTASIAINPHGWTGTIDVTDIVVEPVD